MPTVGRPLTVPQTAETLGISPNQVLALIHKKAEAARIVEAAQAAYMQASDLRRALVNEQAMLRESAQRELLRTADPAIDGAIASCAHQRDELSRERSRSASMPVPQNEVQMQARATWLEDTGRKEAELAERIRELEASKLDPMSFAI